MTSAPYKNASLSSVMTPLTTYQICLDIYTNLFGIIYMNIIYNIYIIQIYNSKSMNKLLQITHEDQINNNKLYIKNINT